MNKISGILAVPGIHYKARAVRFSLTAGAVKTSSAAAKEMGWPVLLPFLYLGAIAGMLFHGAGKFLGLPVDWVLVLTFCMIAYGIYQIDSYVDPGDSISHGKRYSFFQRHKIFKFLGFFSLAASAFLLVVSNRLTAVHVYLLGIGLMYSISLFPWYSAARGWHFTRLKKLPVKGLVIASAWGPGGIIILLQYSHALVTDTAALWAAVAAGVVSNFINNTAADTHDLTADLHEGARTLPVMIGVRKTYIVLSVLAGVFVMFMGLLSFFSIISRPMFLYASVLCFYSLAIKIPCHRWMTKSNKSWFDLLADSYLLLQYAGLILLSPAAVPAI